MKLTPRPVDEDRRSQLLDAGYCVFPSVLSQDQLSQLRVITDELVDAMSEDERRRQKRTGSLIRMEQDEQFSELIAIPGVGDALATLGFGSYSWLSGYIISKPPHSPRLYWHQDGFYWDEEIGYSERPATLFAMYYLVDTTRASGCLRVLPGSHRRRHPIHDQLSERHSENANQADDDHVSVSDAVGECDVEVGAGDLVLGDARLLHATQANDSDHRRTVLVLWYHPEPETFTESLRVKIGTKHLRSSGLIYEEWSPAALDRVRPLLPEVLPASWGDNVKLFDVPDERLK